MVQTMKTVLSFKYADDTVIVGLLGENDYHIENFYTSEIDRFNH